VRIIAASAETSITMHVRGFKEIKKRVLIDLATEFSNAYTI
jgi:hypothetical protein